MAIPIIRTSERRTKKRCEWRWRMAYREGLVPKGTPATPLWFGTGIHECLAQWYRGGLERGIHPADFWLDWIGEEEKFIRTNRDGKPDDYNNDEFINAKELGEAMLVGYVDKYESDESWDVIGTEEPFQIDIPDPRYHPQEDESPELLAIYAGTFDGVYRDLVDGSIWLMEHKTAKTISTRHLPLDDQAGSYWAIASKILQSRGILAKGDRIEGIMYNFLRKAMPDDRPQNSEGKYLNKDGSVSKNQPSPLFVREPVYRDRRERATQLRRIQAEALEMDEARKQPDRIIKNPTQDCSWDCAFYDMCLLHEKGGGDWEDYRDAMFERRDPYADHRKSAGD
jgi:PD-(D/E)XK nuclease superfamily